MIFIVDLLFRLVTRLGDIARRDEYAGIDIEGTFAQSHAVIQALIWRTTVPPPGLPNFASPSDGVFR